SGAGSTKDDRGSERDDDINPTVIPVAFIIELRWKNAGGFIFHQTVFLLETLVFTVQHIVHQVLAEQSTYPYPCHEQGYISHTRCKDVKRCGNSCRQL